MTCPKEATLYTCAVHLYSILLTFARLYFSSISAYGPPKGGNPYGVMSPGDSAIGSGVTSGVTTNAHSAVADGDLEDFKDEEPGSAGAFPPYQQGIYTIIIMCAAIVKCVPGNSFLSCMLVCVCLL